MKDKLKIVAREFLIMSGCFIIGAVWCGETHNEDKLWIAFMVVYWLGLMIRALVWLMTR